MACVLCGSDASVDDVAVFPSTETVALCGVCRPQVAGEVDLDAKHWFCLQQAAWSEVPAVQVVSVRLLRRLTEGWAKELLEQLYLDEETQRWVDEGGDAKAKTVDAHGTELVDGDAVTLIKDLDVKGANFTAKRGTLVKGIRLADDPGLVEGRVNKTVIYLKTEFIKKA